MNLDEKIAFFFTPPAPITEVGTLSSLFMLRREAQDCLIGKVIDEDAVIEEAMRGEHRLFATLMVVAAGVDLLAKFYAGSDDIGGVGARIKNFAARYMFASAKDPARSAEILYQGIRNPLLHSFTLYDRKLEIWLVNRQPGFDIIENPQKPGHVLISVEGVYLAFVPRWTFGDDDDAAAVFVDDRDDADDDDGDVCARHHGPMAFRRSARS
jgi:hypothetical protein